MKYFAIFDKNVATILQLQWNIGNIPDIFLQYSVLCGYEIWHTSETVTTLYSSQFSWQLMADLWFYGILNFLKNGRGSFNFRNLYTNIIYRSRTFGIEFGRKRLNRSNFFETAFFFEFSQKFAGKFRVYRAEILCPNALILTWVMFDTKFWVNRSRPFSFILIWIFFIVTSNFKNSMYPQAT